MIDILMAAYNGERYISEQITSIIEQTYTQWRLFIHDDQSTDHTMAVVESIANIFNKEMEKRSDVRCINALVNPTASGGSAANFLGLLHEAASDYVMFCDQDDVWNPDKVQKTMALMKRLENKYSTSVPLLVYSDLSVADENLNIISSSFSEYMKLPPKLTLSRLLLQNNVSGCTILMNRALYELLRKADEPERVVMHDHFTALVAKALGKIAFLEQPTLKYRQHGDNAVGASNARSFAYLWARYKKGKKQFRKDLHQSAVQAAYIYELYGQQMTDTNQQKLFFNYSTLLQKNKWQRWHFYMKNHVVKYGFFRAIMQFIWG